MECLPDELIVELMTFLESREVCQLSATCKRLRRIGREPCIFKQVSFKNCRWITRKGLSLFLSQYGTFITSLSLRQCHHIGGNILNEQKGNLASLTDLDIVGCGFSLLEIIKTVAGLKHVVSLKMDGYASSNCWTHVNTSTQENFMTAIAQLHSLTVCYRSVHAVRIMNLLLTETCNKCQLMSYTAVLHSRFVVSAVKAVKSLTSLEIYSHTFNPMVGLGGADLSVVSDCLSNSPRLKRICLSTAAFYSTIPVTFPSNLRLGESLKSLRLARLNLNDSVCSVIAIGVFELEELDLSWSHITSDGLVLMSAGKIFGLKKLWLSHTNLFYTVQGEPSVDGLSHVLEKASCLETLDITGKGPDGLHLQIVHHLLASQTKLKTLSIPPELLVTADTSSFSDIISSVFNISSFSVSGIMGKRASAYSCVVADDVLSQLFKWQYLESLTLSWIPTIRSCVGLVSVAQRCSRLRQLCVKGVGLPGHSSTLAPLVEALKHCNQLEIFCLEQRYFNFSPHFGDCLSACSNLKLCHLALPEGRVDLWSVLQVLQKCSRLMGFALFSGMKATDCKRLLKSARSMCGNQVLLVIAKERPTFADYDIDQEPLSKQFLVTGQLNQLTSLY